MSQHLDPYLVIGATGNQGGAVAAELLRRGHQVRALTRNPEGAAAQRLTAEGATVVAGDLDRPESLTAAMAGVAGVFSVQPYDPFAGQAGIQQEVTRGIAVAEAAKDTGVPHVVYSSVDGAERGSGIPHFESKWKVEQRLQELDVPTTVLRPTAYMNDFTERHGPSLVDGTLVVSRALAPGRKLQIVATKDIGHFAADAFENPAEHIGTAVALAGDELTGEDIAQSFADETGLPVRFEEQPLEQVRAFSADIAEMFVWLNQYGYAADIPALRERHPELMSLRDWIRASGWEPPVG